MEMHDQSVTSLTKKLHTELRGISMLGIRVVIDNNCQVRTKEIMEV